MSGSPVRRSGVSRSWRRMTRRCASELRAFSRERPRWGYRQAHQHLLEQGWSINRKRVQRLWREEGLRVPQKRRKRLRRGESTVPGDRLRAQRPDHVWAFDFQFDVTDDGRAVKLLYVVDEFTREALAMEAERRIDGDKVVDVLDRIVAERGTHPEFVRCDNGPEMTSNALRDWCRFSRTGAAFIEPGSPWENPFVESLQQPRPRRAAQRRGVQLPGRGEGDDRGLPPRLQPLPATPSARDDDPRGVQDRLGDRPRGRARQRRTPPPLRVGSVRRRRQPYPADTNHPPALTAGGPMNGVRPLA